MAETTTIEQVRLWCAALPGAVLEFPFGDDAAVYKVGGKMFALVTVDGDPGYVTIKVDPEDGEILRGQHGFIREGYYMNKRHWVTVDLTPEANLGLVDELIEDSYRLVAAGLTRARRAELGIGTA